MDEKQRFSNCFILNQQHILLLTWFKIFLYNYSDLTLDRVVKITELNSTIHKIDCCRHDIAQGFLLSLRLKRLDKEKVTCTGDPYKGKNTPKALSWIRRLTFDVNTCSFKRNEATEKAKLIQNEEITSMFEYLPDQIILSVWNKDLLIM